MSRRGDTGKYEVRWRENGHNRSKSFTRKSDADRFRVEVQRSRELDRPLDLDRGKETLADFIGVYWRRYAVPELSEKTRADYSGVWEKHLRKALGGYRLRDITPAVVDEHKAKLRAAGVGDPTIGKALTLLSGMFRQAVVWDRVDRNPLSEIKIPQPKRVRLVRPVGPHTVEAIRGGLLESGQLRDATVVSMLAYAGVRPGELRALCWGDIGERTIRVERAVSGAAVKKTKTEESRTVRLLAPLARDLEAWREACEAPADAGLVFPATRGGLWTSTNWNNWCKRVYKTAVEGAGIKGSRPYDLRHSFASLLIHEGATIPELARQLGNAPSVTLDTYAHVFDDCDSDRRRDPVEAIEAARAEFDVRAENAEEDEEAAPEERNPASDKKALLRARTADPLLTMRCETVAVGCHWLPIRLSEPLSGAFPFATGCHQLRPLGSINAPSLLLGSLMGKGIPRARIIVVGVDHLLCREGSAGQRRWLVATMNSCRFVVVQGVRLVVVARRSAVANLRLAG